MNTKISYQYRDADNYKYTHAVVVEGKITLNDILSDLDEEEYFCPTDVGLPHPGQVIDIPGFPGESDHPSCELTDGDFMHTEEKSTVDIKADQLINNFHKKGMKGEKWPATGTSPEFPKKDVNKWW